MLAGITSLVYRLRTLLVLHAVQRVGLTHTTSCAYQAEREKCLASGMSDVTVKPLTIQVLNEKMAVIVDSVRRG